MTAHTPAAEKLSSELRNNLPRDFRISPGQLEQFDIYIDLLLKWNKRLGLISKTDENRIVKRHLFESLALLDTRLIPEAAKMLDLGTGAGFPGVPIRITLTGVDLTLLDSKRMKSLFLKEVVRSLKLSSTQVLCDRAENLAPTYANQFDLVTARAVASLSNLWKWSMPLLKAGGFLLAQKGGDCDEEINQLQSAHSGLVIEKARYPAKWDIDPSRFVIAIKKEP